jgi:hypothetical protein
MSKQPDRLARLRTLVDQGVCGEELANDIGWPLLSSGTLLRLLGGADGSATLHAILTLLEARPISDLRSADELFQGVDLELRYHPQTVAAAVRPHAARFVQLAERLLRETEPSEAFGDQGNAASALIAIAHRSGGLLGPWAVRAAQARFEQVMEHPCSHNGQSGSPRHLEELRALGPESIALFLRLMKRWLPRTNTKEALSGLGYSSYSGAYGLVEAAIYELLACGLVEEARSALHRDAQGWTDEETGVFLAIVTSDAHFGDSSGGIDPGWSRRGATVRGLLPVIATRATSATTRRLRRRAQQVFADVPIELPKVVPQTVEGAFELCALLGLDDEVKRPKTSVELEAVPEVLRTLFERCNGLGDRHVVPLARRRTLQKDFESRATRNMRGAEAGSDDDGIDLRWMPPPEQLFAFGSDPGGDFFFVDPTRKTGDDPVFRFVHDEGSTVWLEAATVGAFVAQWALQSWAARCGKKEAIVQLESDRRETATRLTAELRRDYRGRSAGST